MDSKREQAMVGIFVLIASGLLIATVFAERRADAARAAALPTAATKG